MISRLMLHASTRFSTGRSSQVITLLILLLLPSLLWAHGPTRQKVTESVEINASAETVWAVVQNFADATWLPMVDESVADLGNEPGSVRTLTLSSGDKLVERLKSYDGDKMTFKYRIPDATHDVKILPVNNYSSTLTVKANGDTATVTWKGAFYRGYPNNDPPEELNDEAAVKAVTAVYQAGLAHLKSLIEESS